MIIEDIIAPVAQFGAACVACFFFSGVVEGVRRERRLLRGNRELREPGDAERKAVSVRLQKPYARAEEESA